MNLLSFCYLGLRLHVSLDRRWMGQVMGLCDNFNDESNSEWITHSGALTTIAYDFAKSWKIEGPSPCVDDYNPDDYSPCVSIFLYIIHNKRASSVDPDKQFIMGCLIWSNAVCKLNYICTCIFVLLHTVELQWLEHLWDYENVFETGVVRANEC